MCGGLTRSRLTTRAGSPGLGEGGASRRDTPSGLGRLLDRRVRRSHASMRAGGPLERLPLPRAQATCSIRGALFFALLAFGVLALGLLLFFLFWKILV